MVFFRHQKSFLSGLSTLGRKLPVFIMSLFCTAKEGGLQSFHIWSFEAILGVQSMPVCECSWPAACPSSWRLLEQESSTKSRWVRRKPPAQPSSPGAVTGRAVAVSFHSVWNLVMFLNPIHFLPHSFDVCASISSVRSENVCVFKFT